MNIDIQALVNAKLREMEEGKVLENLISETVEKAVTKAVTDAIDGYTIKNIIEEKIEADVKNGVEQIGFTGYNTMVAEQVKNLINSVLKDDLADKLSKVFNTVMLKQRKTIKMSEIIEEYKKLYENADYDDIQDLDDGYFNVCWEEENDDEDFTWYYISFAMKEQRRDTFTGMYKGDSKYRIELKMLQYKDHNPTIASAKFENKDLGNMDTLRNMNDFEALIVSLKLNETEIQIDVAGDEIDSYVGGEYWD